MVGYQISSARIGQDGASIGIQLQQKAGTIDEIVVIGYGTQKRAAVTGAVSSVDSKTIKELPVVNIQQALCRVG